MTWADPIFSPPVCNAVLEGVLFLDKLLGPGWADEIRTGTLKMDNGSACIMGQLAGTDLVPIYPGSAWPHDCYDRAARSLGVDPFGKHAIALGFVIGDEVTDDLDRDTGPEWARLTDEWRQVVERRQEHHA